MHLVGILFLHINDDARSKAHQILIPVGTKMIIVADVKYAFVSTSVPTVSMLRAHTTNSSNPVAIMAKIIPRFPNASFFPLS